MNGFQFRSNNAIDVKDEDDKYKYIEYSIVDNIAYILFHIYWITLRISISYDGQVKFSVKYGDSGWVS